MSRHAPKKALRSETFRRTAKDGRRIVYVRFLGAAGHHVATRSTQETEDGPADKAIRRIAQELDLAAIAKAKAAGRKKEFAEDQRRASVSIADFVKSFWLEGSDYLADREAAGAPLSALYIQTCKLYAKKHIAVWPAFRSTPLSDANFKTIDTFARGLRKKGLSRHIIDRTLDALKKPLNWAAARELCEPIDFSGLVLVAKETRERGVLSDAEIAKILALPTAQLWTAKSGAVHVDTRPRPRLPGKGTKHKGAPTIDARQKAALLLGLFAGLRRGEARGLRWGSVDLERGELLVADNWQDGDGAKSPKAGSFGRVPLAPELEPILWELAEIARTFSLDGPGDFVLMNPLDPKKPVSIPTLQRGWLRILELIGISDDQRRRRHLVPHAARHRFTMKLLDAGFSTAEAGKLSRHRTAEMVERYGAHLSEETLERARRALRLRPAAGREGQAKE